MVFRELNWTSDGVKLGEPADARWPPHEPVSIHQHPAKEPLVPLPPRSWGEVTPEKVMAVAVRFVLADRVVSFPSAELKRWEHLAGNPETLLIVAGRERITIEGQHLAEIRAALDDLRLREVRVNGRRSTFRTDPLVRRITIEPA